MFCLCASQIQSNMISGRRLKMLKWTAIYYWNRVCIDCLQSTFFLKICLVLSQCNCNPRRYVTIRGVANGKIRDSLRRQDPSQKSQPETLVKSFETQKSKNKPCKNETSRLIKNASEISRSCQNFLRPTFFEVPFATPNKGLGPDEKRRTADSFVTIHWNLHMYCTRPLNCN